MHIRRSPSDGPTIYRPSESVALRLDPPPRPVAHEPGSIPPPPRDSLLMRVNRRRGQILTVMVSIAAIASFGSVVWWAHNQDVKAGGLLYQIEKVQFQAQVDQAKANLA